MQVLEGDEPACPSCSTVLCPPVAEWPDGWRRLLYLLTVANALETRLTATEQQQAEWLLAKALRGRTYGGVSLTFGASEADCYVQFVKLFRRWQDAGAPTDVVTVARLRAGASS